MFPDGVVGNRVKKRVVVLHVLLKRRSLGEGGALQTSQRQPSIVPCLHEPHSSLTPYFSLLGSMTVEAPAVSAPGPQQRRAECYEPARWCCELVYS